MIMRFYIPLFVLILVVLPSSVNNVFGQNPETLQQNVVFRSKVCFTDLVEYDKLYPELKPQGRRIKNILEWVPTKAIDPAEIVYTAPSLKNGTVPEAKDPSPEPEADFQALDDSGGSIPPDVNGAVGPHHLMVTLNTDTRIMDKEGNVLYTIGTGAFWQGIPGAGGVFDPKIYYDPLDDRWIYTMPSSSDPATTRLMVAVSETSDPTGNWYRYSFDADPNDELWFDYPDFGFNKKWVVITGNMASSLPQHAVVFIFNKQDLYEFAFEIDYSRIEVFDGFTLIPAVTLDEEEEDVYMVNHAGGNVGGYGYLKLRKVTGDVSDPQIEDIGLSGIPHPWNEWSYFENGDFAPQLGSDEKINTVDARFQNMVFRNNKLWCVHHIYLPAEDPTYSAVQWWELATDGTILQWGREDGGEQGMSYAFASIAVNALEDVMIGYGSFSEEQYASSSYSFRYGDDPPNTLRSRYQFKDGLAPYYKTFGGNRNRWGDYTATCVDPINDLDFWTIQEYAEVPAGQDEWGTWWAKVNVETKPQAQFTSNIDVVPVGSGVDFQDLSKFEPDSWLWTFEGGTPSVSTEQNPQQIFYNEEGFYNVTLIASNAHGADTLTIENVINANTTILPAVDFTVSDSIPCMGDTVVFEDVTVYNPVTWLWEFTPDYVTFVDGSDETSEQPQVVFDFPFNYDVKLTATNNNGSSFLVKESAVKAGGEPLPIEENFESFSLDRMGWTVENPDGEVSWEITTAEGTEPGGLAAFVNIKEYNGLEERDRLVSPPMNFYAFKDVSLTFQYAYSQRFAQYTDSLIIHLSDDCGASWIRLLALGEDGSGNFATAGPMMDAFIPQGPNDWCGSPDNPECISLDLSDWSGQTNIRIAFESYNGFGNNIYIDNLVVEGTVIRVQENSKNTSLRVYPNPSKGNVAVVPSFSSERAILEVFDIRGTLAYTDVLKIRQDRILNLNIEHLKSGIYLIVIKGDELQQTARILIN